MKKRNNKTIVLIVIGIFFVVLFGIFILNYSKDDASFSILEKKWISDNTSNIIDVSVYNDVPVYGNKGKGVIFDLLNDFTDKYKINFNKVSYLSSSSSNLKTTAFRILNSNTEITDNDILLLKNKNVSISHNPISNLNLGCGVAPIKKLIDNNINVSLGTDGQGSGNNLNMFNHMGYVDLLQKGFNQNAKALRLKKI